MRPLFYIIIKSIKNAILELKKKPSKLILYLFFAALLILSILLSGKEGGQKKIFSSDLFITAASIFILLFSVPELLSSLSSGATFFRGADINFVFTSPIRPQKILIYGFIKQAYTSLIAVFFLLFQIPTISKFEGLKPYGIFVIIFGMFLLLMANSIVKILIYSFSSKSEKNKNLIKNIFKLLGVLIVAVYFYSLYTIKSPGKAVTYMLNHKAAAYIPLYGWTREVLSSAIFGVSTSTYIYFALIFAFSFLCIYIIYSMNLDYFEDVIASAELKEQAIAATRSGEKMYVNNVKGKVRKVQYKNKGQGASAIFYRHILESKKTGFGFINLATALYTVLAVTVGFFFPLKDLRAVIGILIYLQLIFTFADKWQQELSNPYVYMIPDSAFKKVIFATAMDNIKNLVDGSIVFLITGILFKSNPILILLNIIAFVSVGSLFVYGGVLTRRVLGNGKNLVMTMLLRMALLILIILPGIVIFAVINGLNSSFLGQVISYIVFTAYNLLFSSIIVLLSQGIFEKIEI